MLAARSVDALERLEQAVEVVGWDRRAAVGYAQDRAVRRCAGRHVDTAGGLVVLDGIAQQVGGEALDQARVAVGEGGGERALDSQPVGLDALRVRAR